MCSKLNTFSSFSYPLPSYPPPPVHQGSRTTAQAQRSLCLLYFFFIVSILKDWLHIYTFIYIIYLYYVHCSKKKLFSSMCRSKCKNTYHIHKAVCFLFFLILICRTFFSDTPTVTNIMSHLLCHLPSSHSVLIVVSQQSRY